MNKITLIFLFFVATYAQAERHIEPGYVTFTQNTMVCSSKYYTDLIEIHLREDARGAKTHATVLAAIREGRYDSEARYTENLSIEIKRTVRLKDSASDPLEKIVYLIPADNNCVISARNSAEEEREIRQTLVHRYYVKKSLR